MVRKVVLFDSSTDRQIAAASSAFGVSENAFVRLAVHRALERILEVYKELVDRRAREFVAERAHLHRRTKDSLKHDSQNSAGIDAIRKSLGSIELTVTEVKAAVDLSKPFGEAESRTSDNAGEVQSLVKSKRAPRSWGKKRYVGAMGDQNHAAWLLDNIKTISLAIPIIRADLEDYFVDQVYVHAARWFRLPELREAFKEKYVGDPAELSELEESRRSGLRFLRDLLDEYANEHRLRAKSVTELKLRFPVFERSWAAAKDEERVKQLEEMISLLEDRLRRTQERQQRQLRYIESQRLCSEVWDDPEELERLIKVDRAPSIVVSLKRSRGYASLLFRQFTEANPANPFSLGELLPGT